MKSKLFYLISFAVLTISLRSVAQTSIPNLSKVVSPSPNVQAMQKYGDIPVGLYNGIPDISIPLYTIKSHDIVIPISVSYHASGIKVAQEASQVGLGWVLNAGGAISRKIIGNDDFIPGDYFNTAPPMPDLTSFYQPLTPIQAGIVYNAGQPSTLNLTTSLYAQEPNFDFEPDEFYYNLPGGKSGKFILLRSNHQPVLRSQEKVDISCLADPGNNNLIDGNVWEIKSVDGYVYDFTQAEYYIPSGGPNIKHTTAVYLTQITSPTGQVVTYHYVPTNSGSVSVPGSFSESYDAGGPQQPTGYIVPSLPQVNTQGMGQIITGYSLSYIDYDNGQVKFNYSDIPRVDVTNDNQLNSVTVYAKDNQGNLQSTPLKTFTFAYDYFVGNNTGNGFNPNNNILDNYIKRLRLNSITESGSYNGQTVTSNPYLFTYYTSSTPNYNISLPLKNSFARDHWGYYNGMTTNTSLIPQFTQVSGNAFLYFEGIMGIQRETNAQNPNVNYMQAFSLSDITYPTGGTTHFDYEANDCDEQKSEINDQAGYNYNYSLVTSPNAPYGPIWLVGDDPNALQILDLRDEFQDPNLGVIPVTVPITFVLGQSLPSGVTVSQTGLATLKIYNYDTGALVNTYDPVVNFQSTIVAGQTITDTQLISLLPGRYKIVPYINTNSSSNYSYYISHISFPFGSWLTQVNSNPAPGAVNPITYSKAGGLRIKRITDIDGIHAPKIKKYIYHYTVNNVEYSYGRRMSRPRYTYWEPSENLFTVTSGDLNSTWLFYPDHTMRCSDSTIPLDGSASGAVVGYDQVTVNNGENGEGGYTVYQYHNNPDIVPAYFYNPYTSGPNLPRYRPYNSNIQDPLNGSLLEQTDYKPGNIPVRDITNTYAAANENDIYAIENHIEGHFAVTVSGGISIIVYGDGIWSTEISPENPYTNSGPVYQDSGAGDRLLFTYPAMQSFWTYLQSTDVKEYSMNDATKYQETLTNYYYSNPSHYLPTSIIVSNSKNEIVTTNISYPLDFTTLNSSEPISQGIQNMITNHVYNAPVEKYVQISAADNSNPRVVSGTLNTYRTDLPLLKTVNQLQIATPILQLQPPTSNNFTPLTITSSSTIKNTAYQPIVSFNYDAAGNLLQQSKTQDINYSYQWAYNKNYPIAQCKNAAANEFYSEGFEDSTAPGIIITAFHTGKKSSIATTVSWTRPNGRAYVITYWYLNSSGAWIFSPEQSYAGSSFNLAVTGATAYDDIRIFPKDAELTTYTFDPLVGMTSVTDPKGMPTYYEYDGLQRLMNIKDKDGNITKNYKYHYKPQVQ